MVFLLAMLAGTCAYAFSGKATDDAFAALLSMPGAGPQTGHWDFPTPNDFKVGTEQGLIVYLLKKQKEGADFNAYRHFGTLLHHAIRAGKVKTAIWLLEHGADPRKPLLGTQTDAMALSQTYQRTRLTKILQNKYGLKVKATDKNAGAMVVPRLSSQSLEYKSPSDFALIRKSLFEISLSANDSLSTPQQMKHAQEEELQEWQAIRARMPPNGYSIVMDDDGALSSLVRMAGRSPKDLNRELTALPGDVIKRHGAAAVAALAEQSQMRISDGKNPKVSYSVPPQSWQTLWRFLNRPIDYTGIPGLAGKVQPELWQELFATGYVNHNPETALGCMLAQIGASDLKALWPRLVENFPNVRQIAPTMVLDSYRLVDSRGPCWSWEKEETKNKLLFLTSVGVKSQVRGIIGRELEYQPADLLAAMKPFISGDQPITNPRFVDSKPTCSFRLDDVWYKELLNKGKLATITNL